MRSFFFAAAASAALAAAQLRIETPTNLVVCQPALLSWGGGTPPYFPAVIPGGQPSAASLKDFPETSGTSLTWNVDLAAGTEVSLRLTDSTGAVNYAERVTIRAGTNTNCLNGNSSAPAASGASAAGAPVAAASSAAGAASSAVRSAGGAASSTVGAASSAAAGAMSSGRGLASSLSASASATPAGARPSASSSGAALAGAKVQLGGVLGLAAGVVGSLFL